MRTGRTSPAEVRSHRSRAGCLEDKVARTQIRDFAGCPTVPLMRMVKAADRSSGGPRLQRSSVIHPDMAHHLVNDHIRELRKEAQGSQLLARSQSFEPRRTGTAG